ncbi:MAG: GlsB/YeaQ/YmgE family stress response membrane protein [Pseudomonadota bacterium]|mgnify:CR=1 FL=1
MDLGAYSPLVTLVVVGLIAGWISGMLFGQRGLIRYLVVGILGALLGGYVFHELLNVSFGLGSAFLDQVAVATIGAVAVMLLARAIAR